MKLIVGLGNIGEKYKNTRHNLGFEVIDRLADNFIDFANLALIKKERDLIFAKPTTFMNNSGVAVRKLVDYYKIEFSNILIILDDCSLNLGNIRLKISGSSGGHNGIKSIIENLGSTDFARLKLGIGQTKSNELAHFVLSKFKSDEIKIVENMIVDATDAVKLWIDEGSEKVMQIFNKKNE